MLNFNAFWSYSHKDDEDDHLNISKLAHAICREYEMQTGDSLELFLDIKSLGWGVEWKTKIEEQLSSVAFFLAVITPRYFSSENCREELDFFSRQARNLKNKS